MMLFNLDHEERKIYLWEVCCIKQQSGTCQNGLSLTIYYFLKSTTRPVNLTNNKRFTIYLANHKIYTTILLCTLLAVGTFYERKKI